MKKFKIGTRVSLGFGIVLVLTVTMITVVVLSKVNSIITEAEHRELRGLFENVSAAIESEGRTGEAMSSLVANIPDVQEAMASNDRRRLEQLLVPPFKALKEQYGARQFQFHTPPAISMFRVHKPEKYGDDLSSFRQTVVATNQTKKPVKGLEKGVAGLGVRGMVPLYNKGAHIGSVEFGMSFGKPFLENFKKLYDVDLSLHVMDKDSFKTYASTLADQSMLTPEELKAALDGKKTMRQMYLNGNPVAAFAGIIKDFSGSPIGVLEVIKDRSEYAEAITDARNMVLFIGLVSVFVGLLIASLITRGIVRPIRSVVVAMEDIAAGGGDLTCRLDASGKDEIAQLSTAFNNFASKMQLMVRDVATSTNQLTVATEAMKQLADNSNLGVDQQRAEIEQVATAMTEMTQTVLEVARNASEAAAAAQQADDEAEKGKQVVLQTISTINSLASEVEKTAEVINRLERESSAIGSVLDVIRGVAEQTNLLALNAAIEAARAGEQGRGFAVVADEVRTLASRTQESTREIHDMIERLQSGARDAVSVMEMGRQQAGNSVNQAQMAGESLEQITHAVNAITHMNVQIATAAEEQSAVAEEINGNVININQLADEVSSGAHQARDSSNELADLSMQMQKLVGQFKV